MFTSRYLCDVLEEMRECVKTLRFDRMPGLIEEVQGMGNRMEAAIGDIKNFNELKDMIHDLKRDKKRLEKEVKTLKEEKEDLGGEKED